MCFRVPYLRSLLLVKKKPATIWKRKGHKEKLTFFVMKSWRLTGKNMYSMIM